MLVWSIRQKVVLGNIEKRGVRGELENKEYSRLESLLEKHKFYKNLINFY